MYKYSDWQITDTNRFNGMHNNVIDPMRSIEKNK